MFQQSFTFNKDVGNWDTFNVTNMELMFDDAYNFNQDLSGWCVSKINTEPLNFSAFSPLAQSNKPIWGTCP